MKCPAHTHSCACVHMQDHIGPMHTRLSLPGRHTQPQHAQVRAHPCTCHHSTHTCKHSSNVQFWHMDTQLWWSCGTCEITEQPCVQVTYTNTQLWCSRGTCEITTETSWQVRGYIQSWCSCGTREITAEACDHGTYMDAQPWCSCGTCEITARTCNFSTNVHPHTGNCSVNLQSQHPHTCNCSTHTCAIPAQAHAALVQSQHTHTPRITSLLPVGSQARSPLHAGLSHAHPHPPTSTLPRHPPLSLPPSPDTQAYFYCSCQEHEKPFCQHSARAIYELALSE